MSRGLVSSRALLALGLLTLLAYGLQLPPSVLSQRTARLQRGLPQRVHVLRRSRERKQEADASLATDDSEAPRKPSLPWKSFLGGAVLGISVTMGLAFGTLHSELEDPDGLYESTTLFSSVLSEVCTHILLQPIG